MKFKFPLVFFFRLEEAVVNSSIMKRRIDWSVGREAGSGKGPWTNLQQNILF
jgi:hypothetical protein